MPSRPEQPPIAEIPKGVEATGILERSLDGDERAVEGLVQRLTPIIARRVVRSLIRTGRTQAASRLDLVRDLTQDVFVDLFENDARVLRRWRPDRGLSLDNFVGMVAERRTLRRLERSFEDPLLSEERRTGSPVLPAAGDPERETLARANWLELLGRLEEELTPTGWRMFQLLFVEERGMAEIQRRTGLGRGAIYTWRNRLRNLVRSLYAELDAARDAPASRVAGSHGTQGGLP